MNRANAIKEAASYFAITLGASFFVFWGPLALFQVPTISFVSQVRGPWWAISLFLAGGFVPSLTGLFLTWKWEGPEGLRRLGRRITYFNIGWLWYLTIVGIILFISAGEVIISRMLTGYAFDLTLFIKQLSSFLPLIIIGPLSIGYDWLHNNTGRSIWTAIFFHWIYT